MRSSIFLLASALLLGSCGGEKAGPPADGAPPTVGGGGGSHHGPIVALGTVTLAGQTFAIAREGECAAGKECGFSVATVGSTGTPALYLWVEDAEGEQASSPAIGDGGDGQWHFHATARPGTNPTKVVVRLRSDGKDERADLPLHGGAAPSHDGISAPVFAANGQVAAWLELKLHDDKGDLELWITTDGAAAPMDLALGTILKASFPVLGDRTVDLRVRDATTNEDEDGKSNIRDGKTNYFIFPGDTGADASWLQGAAFKSAVQITLAVGGASYVSTPFVLTPHSHGADGHDH